MVSVTRMRGALTVMPMRATATRAEAIRSHQLPVSRRLTFRAMSDLALAEAQLSPEASEIRLAQSPPAA